MSQNFSNKMRWVNFICAIFIALLHLSVPFTNNGQWIIRYYQQLSVSAMAFFFFSSAYFHYRNYKQEDYRKKIKKRVLTLLVPYVIWNLIDYVICVLAGYVDFSFTGLVKMFIFIYVPGVDYVHEPMLGVLWFIIRLLTYEVAAPVFLFIIKKKYIFYPSMVAIIVLVYITDINYYAFIYWLPVYLAGAFLAYHYREKIEDLLAGQPEQKNIYAYLKTTLAIMVYVIYTFVMWKFQINYTVERYLSIPIILVCIYFMNCYPKVTWIIKHGSFFLYCSHVPLRMALTTVLLYIEPKLGAILFPQVYMFGIIIIAFCIEWALYKLCPKFLAVLTGNR